MKSIHNVLKGAFLALLARPCGAATSPCAKIAITPGAIPDANTSAAYSQRLAATGGATFGFAITSQGLPPGLSLTNATATPVPGMAFWRGGGCGSIGDYGFTHYSATSLP